MSRSPQPLSLAALWHDTLADTRALMPLALPVAAAFVMLPAVALDLFGPPLPTPLVASAPTHKRPASTTVAATPGVVLPGLPVAIPPDVVLVDLVVPALIGLVAQLAIIRLALDRRRGLARSVGEALTLALRAWPLAVGALVLGAVPIGLGMMALILPGLYLAGRLTPAVPLVLDGSGPIAALERAWALTAGNGWRVIGFTLLFLGWFIVVSAVAGAVGAGASGLLTAAGAGGAGAVVASTIDGLVAALFTVVNAVAVATVYRQLRP